MNLELKRFDMRNIEFTPEKANGPVVVFIGRRDTGKSFLVRDFLYYHQDIPIGTVISGTEAGNGFYAKHVPKLFIHDEYNTAIIENVLKRQKIVIKQIKKENEAYGKSSIDGRAFVILDDCLWDNSWAKDKMMRLLFMNGRHWRIMLIITMQYPLGVPPNLRTNIDYVFICRETIQRNRENLWKNFFGIFPSFKLFCDAMDVFTKNYGVLVLDQTVQSNEIEDCVFAYKATQDRKYKVGNSYFWKYHKHHYKKEIKNNDDMSIAFQNSRSGAKFGIRK